jgi:tetratricopeptide (TPR) repeat protein
MGDRLAKATKLAQQSVKNASDNEEAWLTLGQCYAQQNDLAQAVQCMEHSIDIEAGNGPTYLELSRVYARMGNVAGKEAMMKQYQLYVNHEQERQTLRTRVRRDKAPASDLINYANFLMNMGDISNTEEAVTYYERAYLLTPQDKSLLNTLRILYARLRTPEREEKLLESLKRQQNQGKKTL